jgi:hypothetical protein
MGLIKSQVHFTPSTCIRDFFVGKVIDFILEINSSSKNQNNLFQNSVIEGIPKKISLGITDDM